jgi:carbonic anhydrase
MSEAAAFNCNNATSPINITKSSQSNVCDLKCSYSPNYKNSSIANVVNYSTYLSLPYDPSTTNAQVVYNTLEYSVNSVYLFSPSIHTFNGNNSTAELVIIHNADSGGYTLTVCIPVQTGIMNNNGSNLLNEIIYQTSQNNPSNGAEISSNISLPTNMQYNLNDMIPNNPFYSYHGISCITCTKTSFIVFSSSNLYITNNNANKISTLLQNSNIPIYSGSTAPTLYYNSKGPINSGSNPNDIYIDCKPTNISTETVETINPTPSTQTTSPSQILNNPFINVIFIVLFFVVIFYFFSFLIKWLNNTNTSV